MRKAIPYEYLRSIACQHSQGLEDTFINSYVSEQHCRCIYRALVKDETEIEVLLRIIEQSAPTMYRKRANLFFTILA